MADDQEFAPEASPEPETIPSETPAQESEAELADSPATEDGAGEVGCPIEMAFGRMICGRKLHIAPDGVDEQQVCLMHSKDEGKQSGPLFDEFCRVFEKILEGAEGVDKGEADFSGFVFPNVNLTYRIFKAICRFRGATFTQNANFYKSTFNQNADFFGATFTQNAEFVRATFTQNAYFPGVTFTQNADFYRTKFLGTVNCSYCRFLDQAEFRHTKFLPKEEGTPCAVFSLATFAKPEGVVFDDVDLSRAIFLNCDVSEFQFASSVRWGRRKGNRGLKVFEEVILLDPKLLELQKGHGPIDHGAVEQIYHQLKKNYDARLDYRKANEFHFGEMEMRRLEVRTYPKFLKPWRWLRPRLGPEALYRWASDYGNSFVKPILWLLAALLLAAALFPIPGLETKQPRPGQPDPQTYANVWNKQETWGKNGWTEAKLFGNSLIASIDTASFQRNPEYAPAYPWGRVLALVETLLTSTLFALFLLAIRRQFKR